MFIDYQTARLLGDERRADLRRSFARARSGHHDARETGATPGERRRWWR
ncbi:MAG TPA: hypothetical protein VFI47_02370 [Acidimicrobiales bacterium]|nr:hypothetical protein [Acidimicrobiales bacterium]